MRAMLIATVSFLIVLGAAPAPVEAASEQAQAPAATQAAADCRATNSTVAGGYRVHLACGFDGSFDGFGSTLAAANQEALLLYQLSAVKGVECSGWKIRGVSGGYEVSLSCDYALLSVVGFGSNLTAAASNGRKLAELYADTEVECSGWKIRGVSGGYEVSLSCDYALLSVSAYGSNLTDAATEGLLLAKLYSETGKECSGTDIKSASGGYKVVLKCGFGDYPEGVASTLTGAAQNARLAASIG
jgi:hypothetical protein